MKMSVVLQNFRKITVRNFITTERQGSCANTLLTILLDSKF